MTNLIALEHPGIVVKEEFLDELGVTVYKVAQETGISRTALGQILKGKRSITPNTGLKLAAFFGVSDDYFVKLQMHYDIDLVKEKEKKSLAKIIRFRPQCKKDSGVDGVFGA